jgi:hypothetical protein
VIFYRAIVLFTKKGSFVIRVECDQSMRNHSRIQRVMVNGSLHEMKHIEVGKEVSESDQLENYERTRTVRF